MQIQPTGSSINIAPQTATPTMRPSDSSARTQTTQQGEHLGTSSSMTSPPDEKSSVQEATKRLQNFVAKVQGGDIQFNVDSDSGKTVVKVVDRGTQEVLRQIPSEEALEIARALDRFQGLLVKQQA